MKKIIINEKQLVKLKEYLVENQHPILKTNEGKKATIHVANPVRGTTNREEFFADDTFDDHQKKKISLAKFIDAQSNLDKLKVGTKIIDNEGNEVTFQRLNRLKKGYAVDYLDQDGNPVTKNALSLFILV